MKKIHLYLILFLLSFFVTSTVLASNQLFSNLFFFGDSLSDMGNNLIQAEKAPVTSPGGSTWANYFAHKFDSSAIPSNDGGNDYAYAGAQTGQSIIAGQPYFGVRGQINLYLSTNTVDPHALYSLWVGGNDLKDHLNEGPPTHRRMEDIAIATVHSINELVTSLHQAGANYILVPNMRDLGLMPAEQNTGLASILSFGTRVFNQSLLTQLNADNFQVIQTDIYSLYNDIFANPGHFGFTNITDACFNTTTGETCSNPNQYFSWDGTHPTALGEQEIADYNFSIIAGPTAMAVLAEAPFSIMDAQNDNIEQQFFNIRGSDSVPIGQNSFFVNTSYTSYQQDSQATSTPGFDANSKNILAGGLHRFKNFMVGGAVAYSYSPVDFGNNMGDFDVSETIGSVFGSYQYKHFYTDAIADVGIINFNNITRNVPIGPSENTANSSTHGTQFGGDLTMGYNLIDTALKTGPLVNADYQNIHVNSFTETGSINGIAESFGGQSNDSFVTGAGWQASYATQWRNNPIMPFAQFTYNHPWQSTNRDVTASLVSLPGSHFTIPVTANDNNFGLINVGISALFLHNISASISYQDTIFYQGANMQNISAGIQVAI